MFDIFLYLYNIKSMEKKKFKISDVEIKTMYLDGYSLNDIANVAQDTKGVMPLRRRLQDLGVDTSKNMKRYRKKISISSRIYQIDDSVFNCIDTQEKAYWLGFLMSDGYNNENNNCVSLRLHYKDIDVLEKFKEFLKTDTPIHIYNRNISENKIYCDLTVSSYILSSRLSDLGCVQGKTSILEFPNIPKYLYSHFIRGYFDGDGCVSIIPRKDRKEGSKQYQLNFVGKESVLLKIQEIICDNTGVTKTKLRNRKNSFVKAISWSGKNVCKKILDFLYKDANTYMHRKYNKYLQFGNSAE